MADAYQLFQETLRRFDGTTKLEWHEFGATLEEVARDAKARGEVVEGLQFELIATSLVLNDEPDVWGTYFGPESSRVSNDGTRVDWPPLASITPDCIGYWSSRMNAARQPALRARYGDLVWDLSQKVAGTRPPIVAAQIAIDGYVAAIVTGVCEPFDGPGDIQKRAIHLAASVDDNRLRTSIAQLIQYAAVPTVAEEREFRQRKLFGLLMEIRGRRRPIEELKSLATDLRTRLDDLSVNQPDQFSIQDLALPLAEYYRSTQQCAEISAVLHIYGAAVERTANATSMAILALSWLTKLHEVYQRFGLHDDARSLLPKLEARSGCVNQELVRISHRTTIPKEEFDQAVEDVISGTKSEVLRKLAVNFLPRVKDTEKLVKDIASQTFFMNVFTQQISTEDGRVTATIGPVAEDLDGHVVQQLGQTMQFLGQLYRPTIEKAVATHQFTADDCVEWLYDCPLFVADRMPLLKQAFASYLNEDWATAIHLAIPQIENALRQVLVICRQTLLRPHRNGTFLVKNLDEILRDPVAELALPKDVRVYLRTLLCDQRGLNVRNNVCHGLWGPKHLNWFIADRIIHAVLVIGLLRPNVSSPKSTAEG
jgi:hypothetical protein